MCSVWPKQEPIGMTRAKYGSDDLTMCNTHTEGHKKNWSSVCSLIPLAPFTHNYIIEKYDSAG